MADESEDQWLYGDSVDGKEVSTAQSHLENTENEDASNLHEDSLSLAAQLPFNEGPPGVRPVLNLYLDLLYQLLYNPYAVIKRRWDYLVAERFMVWQFYFNKKFPLLANFFYLV